MKEQIKTKINKAYFYLFWLLSNLLSGTGASHEIKNKPAQEVLETFSLDYKTKLLLPTAHLDFLPKDLEIIANEESQTLYKLFLEKIKDPREERKTPLIILAKICQFRPDILINIGFFKGRLLKEYNVLINDFAESVEHNGSHYIFFNALIFTQEEIHLRLMTERKIIKLDREQLNELIKQIFTHELVHILIKEITKEYLVKKGISGKNIEEEMFAYRGKYSYDAFIFITEQIFSEPYFDKEFRENLWQIYKNINEKFGSSLPRARARFGWWDEWLAYLISDTFTDKDGAYKAIEPYIDKKYREKLEKIIDQIQTTFIGADSPLPPNKRKPVIIH